MKARKLVALLSFFLVFASCAKNTVSKIPQISLIAFYPETEMTANIDTCFLQFNILDGDADIGNDSSSAIYYIDSRFETNGYLKADFPYIDPKSEDPQKGMNGTVLFIPNPAPVPRRDSFPDTFYYRFYVTDRARHHSDTITTHALIIKPF